MLSFMKAIKLYESSAVKSCYETELCYYFLMKRMYYVCILKHIDKSFLVVFLFK